MRRLLSCSAVVVLLAAAALAAGPADRLAEALAQGEQLIARGRYEEALKALKRAESLSGEPSGKLLVDLAACYNQLSRFERSERYARRALEVSDDGTERTSAYFLLGLSLARERPAEAEAAFRRVLELTGWEAHVARLRLGEVLVSQGKAEEACAVLDELLGVVPAVDALAAQARWAMTRASCEEVATPEPGPRVWTEVRTAHFRVLGNDRAQRVRQIAVGAERLLAALERLTPGEEPASRQPYTLYGFADRSEYERYAPIQGDAGFFVPHPHGVFAVFETNEGATRRIYRQLVLHFLESRLRGLPEWFRRGVAELYSNLKLVDGELHLGLGILEYSGTLRLPQNRMPAAELLAAGPSEAAEMPLFDAWSWGLVHSLTFGDPRLGGKVAVYLELVAELERPWRAFDRAFALSAEEAATLVRSHFAAAELPFLRLPAGDFPAEVTDGRELSATETALALAELRLHTDPAELASVAAEARRLSAAEPESPAVWVTLGEAAAAGGDADSALAALRRAVELDAGGFKAHLMLGSVLLDRAATAAGASPVREEAIAALERAAELRPDSFPAWERLAYAYAHQASPPERAVEAATRALSLQPGRADLTFNLLLVRAKRREIEEVRRLVRRLEALGGDARQVASARDMLFQLTFQQARGLMAEDRLDDAVGLLAEIKARVASERMRATAVEWIGRIRGVQQYNRFVERYNEAVVAYDADDWDRSLEVLDSLTAEARPGMQARLVEALRAEVEYWRD